MSARRLRRNRARRGANRKPFRRARHPPQNRAALGRPQGIVPFPAREPVPWLARPSSRPGPQPVAPGKPCNPPQSHTAASDPQQGNRPSVRLSWPGPAGHFHGRLWCRPLVGSVRPCRIVSPERLFPLPSDRLRQRQHARQRRNHLFRLLHCGLALLHLSQQRVQCRIPRSLPRRRLR